MMLDGLLESDTVEFPKLRDVLGPDFPGQSLQMNMNF